MALGIEVNLYAAREAMADDLERTLDGIARIGYLHVEMAGYHGRTAQKFKAILDASQLTTVSAHVPLHRFDSELEAVIAEGRLFGLEALVVPWLTPEQRDEAFLRELPIKLDTWGEEVVKAGMRLAWHNHEFEYQIGFDQRTFMQILLRDVHLDYVDTEADLYWIAEAGLDPITELWEMQPRVRMLHAKDRSPDGAFANVGQGVFKWAEIVAEARAQYVDWLIVEHDEPIDLMADLSVSYQHLLRLVAVD